jgi:hypothetical protein
VSTSYLRHVSFAKMVNNLLIMNDLNISSTNKYAWPKDVEGRKYKCTLKTMRWLLNRMKYKL